MGKAESGSSKLNAEERSEAPVGLTRDSGWQIGVRRTFPVSADKLWQVAISDRGVKLWLGDTQGNQLRDNTAFSLANETEIRVTVFKPGSHLRLRWHPIDWPRPSTIQLRVVDKGKRAVLAFHQEHLPAQSHREARKAFFTRALNQFEQILEIQATTK